MPAVGTVAGKFGFGRPPRGSAVGTTNLQVWLDAANTASYPGSGTTWSNLAASGSTYNYTLANSPTLSTVNYNGTANNAIALDGTNDYVRPNNSLLTLAQANNWAETREVWLHWRGSPGNLYHENGATTPDTGWFDAQAALSNTALTYSVWQGSIGMTPYLVYNSLTSNAWNHIIWQHNKGTNTMMAYVNGVRTYSNAAVSRTTPDSVSLPFYLILGSGSATNFGAGSASYLGANVGVFRWYNSILSSNDINSNFSAERGRFGV